MIEPQRPSSATELEDLRERLERLEARSPKPRGRTGMRGAAEYIGRSKEWLRLQHLRGQGPPRMRVGARCWSYGYDDLDMWLAEQAHEHA
jgi:hypothetical protein